MTLEFEKLREDVEKMALSVVGRQRRRQAYRKAALKTIEKYATDWLAIEKALKLAEDKAEQSVYRSAEPFDHKHPLNIGIDPPSLPPQATIISVDGSQIMPDRHAAYLYYLVNVGGIVYRHGSYAPPDVFSYATLKYPEDDIQAVEFSSSENSVSIARDLKEIGTLAVKVFEEQGSKHPVIALVDQRLLYFPVDERSAAGFKAIDEWLDQMSEIHKYDGVLGGYISRSSKISVTTLLQSLEPEPDFDWSLLGKRVATKGLTDVELFGEILQEGQRSKIFVEVSPSNRRFASKDKNNEICFFYFRPDRWETEVARVEIPRWVAENEAAVNNLHAVLYDQCQITVGHPYPYVLTRADEIARVRRHDQTEFNFMIELAMQRHDIDNSPTAKSSSKPLVGHGQTTHHL